MYPRRSSSVMSTLPAGATTTPTEHSGASGTPATSTCIPTRSTSSRARRSAWVRPAASSSAAAGPSSDVISSPNSSPDSRATSSSPRAYPRIRSAIVCSSWSPAACPSVSLTSRKWSTSSSSRATAVSRSSTRSAPLPLASSASRLASLVSPSCDAACRLRADSACSSRCDGASCSAAARASANADSCICSRGLSCTGSGKCTRSSPTSAPPTCNGRVSVSGPAAALDAGPDTTADSPPPR